MRASLSVVDENTCVNSWISTASAHLPGLSPAARSSCLRSISAGDALVHSSSSLEKISETAKVLPEFTRETQQLVKEARELVGQVGKLSGEANSATGAVRDDTLPRVNALAESVERSAQRVGRLALQLDREPQSAIFGRGAGRPGPGEPGFQ